MSILRNGNVKSFFLDCPEHVVRFRSLLTSLKGPLLGIDVGSRHVGVALSDEGRMIAFPYLGYPRSSLSKDRSRISTIVAEKKVSAVVVGMPIPPSGLKCEALQQFVILYSKSLVQNTDIPAIAYIGEAYSTAIAAENLQEIGRKKRKNNSLQYKAALDSSAAKVILQDALDLYNKKFSAYQIPGEIGVRRPS